MDTLMVRKLLKNFKCFKGVFPCDKIPFEKTLPLNIIVNTDPSYLPGEHWVCISIDRKGRGEYFDSFGLPPLREEIFNFLENKCPNGWSYNKVVLQSFDSRTCGHYCVLNIIFKCKGRSTAEFISQFHRNTEANDIKMREIFKTFHL